MKLKTKAAATLAILAFFVFSCAPSALKKPEEPEAPTPVKLKKQMPIEEQEKGAMKVFNDILEMSMENERLFILPQIAAKYEELITEYPDSKVAEEVHWRLLRIYIVDMRPANEENGERTYKAFKSGYPNSKWMPMAEDSMARFYYNIHKWDKLLLITTPSVVDYIKTGTLKNPMFLFLYSESKFFSNDDTEAEKGFLTVLQHFKDNTYESKVSKERLQAIKSRKK